MAFVVAALGVLAVSQLSSYLVTARLSLHESYPVTSFLHVTYIQNTGGIFGAFQDSSTLFALVGGTLVLGLSWYVLRSQTLELYQCVCFGLIAGAAASNVCDRFVYGAVVDFIDVRGIPFWSYIFNVADTAIHFGVWPMVLMSLLRRDHPDRTHPDSTHDRT
jgi:signal peptidase II